MVIVWSRREVLERQKVERGGGDHEHRAHDLQPQTVGREQGADAHHAEEGDEHEQEDELSDEARPDDLGDGQPLPRRQKFGGRVEAGEEPDGDNHEADRLEAVGSRVWRHVDRFGGHRGLGRSTPEDVRPAVRCWRRAGTPLIAQDAGNGERHYEPLVCMPHMQASGPESGARAFP